MTAHDIIRRPIISEKSLANVNSKKYVFEVDKKATKTQVKSAVEEIFKVKVESVNISNVYGKIKRQGKCIVNSGRNRGSDIPDRKRSRKGREE